MKRNFKFTYRGIKCETERNVLHILPNKPISPDLVHKILLYCDDEGFSDGWKNWQADLIWMKASDGTSTTVYVHKDHPDEPMILPPDVEPPAPGEYIDSDGYEDEDDEDDDWGDEGDPLKPAGD